MVILEWIAKLFSGEMPTPSSFGLFHFLSVLVILIATILICKFFKDCSDKVMQKIVLISWIILVVLEGLKQLVFTYTSAWDFQWYAFPFQLCSSPLYALPFIAFMKDCKFRDAMMAYVSTFSFLGGFIVFIYPNDVFISLTFINYQTMIHHGLQILIGIFLFVYNRKKVNLLYFARAILVFVAFCLVAVSLNEIMHYVITTNSWDDTFNMFYISRFYPNHLPILSIVYTMVNPVIFILIYVIGFTGLGLLIQYLMIWIMKLVNLIIKNIKTKNA